MGSAIGLRDDFDGAGLRRLARGSKSANQARRLLALAQIYDGGSRSEAAKIGGVTLQIVRDWVIRFNARGPDGLLDGKAPGKPSILDDAQRRALVEVVERGPIPAMFLAKASAAIKLISHKPGRAESPLRRDVEPAARERQSGR